MVINYAHRGASEYFPENTMKSFLAGLEMRADGIETDIQRTKDGVLVLHHDDTLKRIVGIDRPVCDFTYDELLGMDFGAFKGEAFAGERIVTLDAFLTQFGGKNLTLALEIKQVGVEADVLACIEKHGCRDHVIITSFKWESIAEVRRLDDEIRIGYLTVEITEETLDLLEVHGMQQICPKVAKVTEESMALARSRGFSVRFWGVSNEELMHKALSLGGDGMTVNFPDKLTAALRR